MKTVKQMLFEEKTPALLEYWQGIDKAIAETDFGMALSIGAQLWRLNKQQAIDLIVFRSIGQKIAEMDGMVIQSPTCAGCGKRLICVDCDLKLIVDSHCDWMHQQVDAMGKGMLSTADKATT